MHEQTILKHRLLVVFRETESKCEAHKKCMHRRCMVGDWWTGELKNNWFAYLLKHKKKTFPSWLRICKKKKLTCCFKWGATPAQQITSLKNLCLNTSHNHLVCKLVTHKKERGLTILAGAWKSGECLWCTTTHHTFQHSCMHELLTTSNRLETHPAEARVPTASMCGGSGRQHGTATRPTTKKK